MELKKPFPTEGASNITCIPQFALLSTFGEGTVTCVGRLVDVLDKKSGAVVIIDGEPVTSIWSVVYTCLMYGGKKDIPYVHRVTFPPTRSLSLIS